MQKKYQVFVSSTYEDLIEERKEVTQALLECGCIPTGMELFPASSKKQWEIIKRVIDDCDYYLLILAGRYGSYGKDDDGKQIGYTEMEYDYALITGKPIIVFIHNDINSIPSSRCEHSKTGQMKLNKFRKKVSDKRMIQYWTNKDNLKSAVLQSVPAMIQDSPAKGWIKAGDIVDSNSLLSIINSEFDIYSGTWRSTTEQGYVDLIKLKYDEKSHLLSGDIIRVVPENEPHRKWHGIGCVVGESLLMIYYSHSINSAGCALLRHYRNTTYKGYYLRYNYGTRVIDKMEIYVEKIEE